MKRVVTCLWNKRTREISLEVQMESQLLEEWSGTKMKICILLLIGITRHVDVTLVADE